MNDILNNVMTFINENTYLLIGICVFLIFVLIGYLIDNSVKSKRVRNEIENKNDVVDEDKKDIIEPTINDSEEVIPTSPFEEALTKENEIKEEIINETNNDIVSIEPIKEDIINTNIVLEDMENTEVSTSPFEDVLIKENEIKDESDGAVVSIEPIKEDTKSADIMLDSIKEDPDYGIMNDNNEKEKYSNNKTLLQILSDVDESKLDNLNSIDNNENIFNVSPDIIINTNVEKEKVEIEPKYSSDEELDKIMKKLSSINSEEDNYTNIF